jgi:hypothetical protein
VKVEYVALPEEHIDVLAYAVCQHMAETKPQFARSEIRNGFARFLKVMIRIQVQQLNRDSEQEQSVA